MNNILKKGSKLLKAFPMLRIKKPRPLEPQHGIYIAGGVIVLVFFYGILMRSNGNTPLSLESKWMQNVAMYYDPIELLEGADDIQLVDIRSAEAFTAGHITGARNLPFEIDDKNIVEYEGFEKKLDEIQKEDTLVLYGENNFQKNSYIAADYLQSKGYEVRILRIGWSEFRNFPSFWIPEDRINDFNLIEYMDLQGENQP